MSRSVSIVMYHYVRDMTYQPYSRIARYAVAIESFKQQIAYYMEHYTIITPGQFIDSIQNNTPLPEKSLLMTFDDGYADHYNNVFPVLIENQLKAFFFPSAMPVVEKKLLNTNKVQLIFEGAPREALYNEFIQLVRDKRTNMPIDPIARMNSFQTIEEKDAFIADFLQHKLSFVDSTALINRLFRSFVNYEESDIANSYYMNIRQLKELAEAGMNIGCHGYSHYRLNALSSYSQAKEIGKALGLLKQLNREKGSWVMCYPYGAYDRSLISLLGREGFIAGLATIDGIADLDTDSHFILPRIDEKKMLRI